jgi:hypothetical protein
MWMERQFLRTGGMCLPSKHKVLSSNLTTPNKEREKERKGKGRGGEGRGGKEEEGRKEERKSLTTRSLESSGENR